MTKMNMTTECRNVVDSVKPELMDWGFRFLVDTDTEAFKIAYAYRNSKHGTKVEHCPAVGKFSVTIWNETAKQAGCDVY